jgi:hypothetical protein
VKIELIADIALFITAASLIGALFELRQNYRQRQRQFEEMYVQRYWSIIDDCSLEAMSSHPSKDPTDSDEKAIRAYIRLCEDELQVRAEGWISDGTYRMWGKSIRMLMRLPMFAQAWQRVNKESIFPYQHMDRLLSAHNDDDAPYDPCRMGLLRRWLRGLAGVDGI